MVRKPLLIIYIILLLLGVISESHEQTADELNFIAYYNPLHSVNIERPSPFTFYDTNEIKVSIMGCIRFYQLFISSQDIPVCNFTPSCSKFGMAAIKKYGVFYGGLMTFDRLQRCNGLGRKYYPIHPVTDKSYDPIERNTWQD